MMSRSSDVLVNSHLTDTVLHTNQEYKHKSYTKRPETLKHNNFMSSDVHF